MASNDADPPPSGTSDASTPDPKDLVLFLENGRPDPQYVFPPWTAPDELWEQDYEDEEPYQVFYNTVTGNQIKEHPLIY